MNCPAATYPGFREVPNPYSPLQTLNDSAYRQTKRAAKPRDKGGALINSNPARAQTKMAVMRLKLITARLTDHASAVLGIPVGGQLQKSYLESADAFPSATPAAHEYCIGPQHDWPPYISPPGRDVFTPYLKAVAARRGANEALEKQYASPEVVATFLGTVDSIGEEGKAFVSLLNENTNERLEAECDSQSLKHRGIREGDEFRCLVIQNTDGALVKIVRLEPKPLSLDKVATICEQVKDIDL